MSLPKLLLSAIVLSSIPLSAAGLDSGRDQVAAWTWSTGIVIAGTDVTVKVTEAPCYSITVKLYIRGQLADSAEITEAPGQVDLSVPAGSEGCAYAIVVSCGSESDSKTGIVE